MRSKVSVLKLDPQGNEVFRWQGELLSKSKTEIKLHTIFNDSNFDQHGLHLRTGDRLIEVYYFHKWYNIFEIHDRDNDSLKGWYCNVAYPVEMEDGAVTFRDLALDLVVLPDGQQIVLDEDEFEGLKIPQKVKEKALFALRELQDKFKEQFEQPSEKIN